MMYLAIDQYDNRIILNGEKSPRAMLLEELNASKCEKMYIDKTDGTVAHVGYIVKNQWFTIYNLSTWEGGKS